MSRKITRAMARIRLGLQACLFLGNLAAKRDWGHAKDYVEMQWLMLQQEEPEDFVIATGEQHSVRDFVVVAANELGISIRWEGSGIEEKGFDASGNCIVRVQVRSARPTEVASLLGDSSKARTKWLGPQSGVQGAGRGDGAERLALRSGTNLRSAISSPSIATTTGCGSKTRFMSRAIVVGRSC